MRYLHTEVDAGPGDVVRIVLDKQANLQMMDGVNYRQEYMAGGPYTGPLTVGNVPKLHTI